MSEKPDRAALTRAQALGRLAGGEGVPVTACPYTKEQRALRIRWMLGHADGAARREQRTATVA